ncbi:hypothetical protein IMY05_C4504000600 [Salix suchowensis]|nr:hypothetical protein IMY05_C4504000600 [Salix suchowensis]
MGGPPRMRGSLSDALMLELLVVATERFTVKGERINYFRGNGSHDRGCERYEGGLRRAQVQIVCCQKQWKMSLRNKWGGQVALRPNSCCDGHSTAGDRGQPGGWRAMKSTSLSVCGGKMGVDWCPVLTPTTDGWLLDPDHCCGHPRPRPGQIPAIVSPGIQESALSKVLSNHTNSQIVNRSTQWVEVADICNDEGDVPIPEGNLLGSGQRLPLVVSVIGRLASTLHAFTVSWFPGMWASQLVCSQALQVMGIPASLNWNRDSCRFMRLEYDVVAAATGQQQTQVFLQIFITPVLF